MRRRSQASTALSEDPAACKRRSFGGSRAPARSVGRSPPHDRGEVDIADKDAQADGKVVGSCDGGTKKIVYKRG